MAMDPSQAGGVATTSILRDVFYGSGPTVYNEFEASQDSAAAHGAWSSMLLWVSVVLMGFSLVTTVEAAGEGTLDVYAVSCGLLWAACLLFALGSYLATRGVWLWTRASPVVVGVGVAAVWASTMASAGVRRPAAPLYGGPAVFPALYGRETTSLIALLFAVQGLVPRRSAFWVVIRTAALCSAAAVALVLWSTWGTWNALFEPCGTGEAGGGGAESVEALWESNVLCWPAVAGVLCFQLFLTVVASVVAVVGNERSAWLRFVEHKRLQLQAVRAEELLTLAMPRPIAHELMAGKVDSTFYPSVSVGFLYITGMDRLVYDYAMQEEGQAALVDLIADLHDLVCALDALVLEHKNVYKIETVGNVMLVVSGVPFACEHHALAMLQFCLEALELFRWRRRERLERLKRNRHAAVPPAWTVKIGICSGPVHAGVVGRTRKFLRLFGDTVNTASRMGSKSEKGRIHISGSTWAALGNPGVVNGAGSGDEAAPDVPQDLDESVPGPRYRFATTDAPQRSHSTTADDSTSENGGPLSLLEFRDGLSRREIATVVQSLSLPVDAGGEDEAEAESAHLSAPLAELPDAVVRECDVGWTVQRRVPMDVKGKGIMQTYFVDLPRFQGEDSDVTQASLADQTHTNRFADASLIDAEPQHAQPLPHVPHVPPVQSSSAPVSSGSEALSEMMEEVHQDLPSALLRRGGSGGTDLTAGADEASASWKSLPHALGVARVVPSAPGGSSGSLARNPSPPPPPPRAEAEEEEEEEEGEGGADVDRPPPPPPPAALRRRGGEREQEKEAKLLRVVRLLYEAELVSEQQHKFRAAARAVVEALRHDRARHATAHHHTHAHAGESSHSEAGPVGGRHRRLLAPPPGAAGGGFVGGMSLAAVVSAVEKRRRRRRSSVGYQGLGTALPSSQGTSPYHHPDRRLSTRRIDSAGLSSDPSAPASPNGLLPSPPGGAGGLRGSVAPVTPSRRASSPAPLLSRAITTNTATMLSPVAGSPANTALRTPHAGAAFFGAGGGAGRSADDAAADVPATNGAGFPSGRAPAPLLAANGVVRSLRMHIPDAAAAGAGEEAGPGQGQGQGEGARRGSVVSAVRTTTAPVAAATGLEDRQSHGAPSTVAASGGAGRLSRQTSGDAAFENESTQRFRFAQDLSVVAMTLLQVPEEQAVHVYKFLRDPITHQCGTHFLRKIEGLYLRRYISSNQWQRLARHVVYESRQLRDQITLDRARQVQQASNRRARADRRASSADGDARSLFPTDPSDARRRSRPAGSLRPARTAGGRSQRTSSVLSDLDPDGDSFISFMGSDALAAEAAAAAPAAQVAAGGADGGAGGGGGGGGGGGSGGGSGAAAAAAAAADAGGADGERQMLQRKRRLSSAADALRVRYGAGTDRLSEASEIRMGPRKRTIALHKTGIIGMSSARNGPPPPSALRNASGGTGVASVFSGPRQDRRGSGSASASASASGAGGGPIVAASRGGIISMSARSSAGDRNASANASVFSGAGGRSRGAAAGAAAAAADASPGGGRSADAGVLAAIQRGRAAPVSPPASSRLVSDPLLLAGRVSSVVDETVHHDAQGESSSGGSLEAESAVDGIGGQNGSSLLFASKEREGARAVKERPPVGFDDDPEDHGSGSSSRMPLPQQQPPAARPLIRQESDIAAAGGGAARDRGGVDPLLPRSLTCVRTCGTGACSSGCSGAFDALRLAWIRGTGVAALALVSVLANLDQTFPDRRVEKAYEREDLLWLRATVTMLRPLLSIWAGGGVLACVGLTVFARSTSGIAITAVLVGGVISWCLGETERRLQRDLQLCDAAAQRDAHSPSFSPAAPAGGARSRIQSAASGASGGGDSAAGGGGARYQPQHTSSSSSSSAARSAPKQHLSTSVGGVFGGSASRATPAAAVGAAGEAGQAHAELGGALLGESDVEASSSGPPEDDNRSLSMTASIAQALASVPTNRARFWYLQWLEDQYVGMSAHFTWAASYLTASLLGTLVGLALARGISGGLWPPSEKLTDADELAQLDVVCSVSFAPGIFMMATGSLFFLRAMHRLRTQIVSFLIVAIAHVGGAVNGCSDQTLASLLCMMALVSVAVVVLGAQSERLMRRFIVVRLAATEARMQADQVMTHLLPSSVAEKLSRGDPIPFQVHPNPVVIIFADLVGFTALSQTLGSGEVLQTLDRLYSQFDDMVIRNRLYKLDTIGDAYVVCGGLVTDRDLDAGGGGGNNVRSLLAAATGPAADSMRPLGAVAANTAWVANSSVDSTGPRSASASVGAPPGAAPSSAGASMIERVFHVAIAMRDITERVRLETGYDIGIRIGIHAGTVATGIIGTLRPRFHIFGPTVLEAEQMEHEGTRGRIQVSEQAYNLYLTQSFQLQPRPEAVPPVIPGPLSEEDAYNFSNLYRATPVTRTPERRDGLGALKTFWLSRHDERGLHA